MGWGRGESSTSQARWGRGRAVGGASMRSEAHRGLPSEAARCTVWRLKRRRTRTAALRRALCRTTPSPFFSPPPHGSDQPSASTSSRFGSFIPLPTCPPSILSPPPPASPAPQVAEQIRSIIDQYDREDFDLGIKQFMLEAKVKAVGVPPGCRPSVSPPLHLHQPFLAVGHSWAPLRLPLWALRSAPCCPHQDRPATPCSLTRLARPLHP